MFLGSVRYKRTHRGYWSLSRACGLRVVRVPAGETRGLENAARIVLFCVFVRLGTGVLVRVYWRSLGFPGNHLRRRLLVWLSGHKSGSSVHSAGSGRRYGDMHTAAAQWRFVHGAGALGATYVPGPAAHPSGFLSTNLAPASILLAQAAAMAICT